jgi:hypothetical protein
MKQTNNSWIGLAAAVAMLVAPLALADSSTFLTVPNHGEEALTWCGAAVGQMIVGGYPASACTVTQTDMWDKIQFYKVESGWDSDPVGLQKAMANLCPPSGGWFVFQNTDPTQIMYSVAHYMFSNKYPVAVLLDTASHNAATTHREHWVAVKGIVTDKDPIPANSPVTLKYILIYDQPPAVATSAVERFLTGAQWYGEFQAATIAGTYSGKYVAVIEPPVVSGRAIAPRLPVTGTIIPAERAAAAAARALTTTLASVGPFRNAANLQPQPPLLVNPERGGYYIVAFAAPRSAPTLSILINAYNGEFMEAGRFTARRPAMTDREALSRASAFVRQPGAKAIAVREGASPYFPSWRVTAGNEEVVIDPEGNIRRPTLRPR